jgi:cell division protein FtsQ
VITRRRMGVRVRVLVVVLAVLAVLGGGWLWLRGSSLVAVRKVTISGVYGPDAGQIRSALNLAARNMTTLDVRIGQLRTAVAPYTVVKDVRVATDFPHGLRINVLEQLPVGALVADGRAVAVSGDGTLLPNVSTRSLPQIPVGLLPGGSQITDRGTLQSLALLSATSPRLLARIAQVTDNSSHGLVAQLRSGPSIYFGDDSDLNAKWAAATEVLADPTSAGASYVDVTDPASPAAGASPEAVAAAGLATGGTDGSTATGTSAPSASTAGTGVPASAATTPSTGG